MNDQNSTDLIDENEIRAAVRPLCPDADAFAATVQEKLKSSLVSASASPPKNVTARSSDWTSVAAAVIPIPLFGNAGANTAGSLAQVSFSKKVIAMVALPAISLLLMLGGTLWCMFKISRVSKDADPGEFDSKASLQVVSEWWKRFGWVGVAVPFLQLALTKFDIEIPLVLIFAVSGLAMVWLVTELGRRGLVDRQYLAGGMTTGLIVLIGLANMEKIIDSSIHLLDQSYISVVLTGGMFFLIAIHANSAAGGVFGDRKTQLLTFGVLMIPLGFLHALIFQSLWLPVTTERVQQYVADFKEAPYSSASWQQWVVPARWLKENGFDVDTSGAKRLAVQEAADGKNPIILSHALEFGLITADQAPIDDFFGLNRKQLFEEHSYGTPISSVRVTAEYVVRKLLLEGQLTQQQRDILSDRLAETLRVELSSERVYLENVQTITDLMTLIDRPADRAEFSVPIHELLRKLQRLKPGAYRPIGGFAACSAHIIGGGDDNATLAAIELMEDWGVPEGIDLMALRSYLRPSYQDRNINRKLPGIRAGGAFHFVGRQRLNDMPDVPAVTWWDYLRYERNLMMSLLLITLSIYAVLAAPDRLPAHNQPTLTGGSRHRQFMCRPPGLTVFFRD